jgi:hypothetical protein
VLIIPDSHSSGADAEDGSVTEREWMVLLHGIGLGMSITCAFGCWVQVRYITAIQRIYQTKEAKDGIR